MAEGIESYDHVPQQSRRDKLREQPDRSAFLPIPIPITMYDPSLDILPSAAAARFQFHHPSPSYFDPHSSLLPDIHNPNPNPLFCFGGADVAAFKPEPLSLSLSSHPYGHGLLPLGPFTGYASILKASRFLKPAQHLLEELCDGVGPDSCLPDPTSDTLAETGILDDPGLHSPDAPPGNKSTLLSMLDEVYRRYKQYYQQIQEVMTSFEYISGLGNAAPYANQAIKAMYKHFKCLKNAILDQLQFTKKTHGGDYCQRSVQNSGFNDHQPVWRPQRGLPERAVTVLRAWLFEHFLHPYPSDTDKLMLAKQTGLSRSQVSNWFINARVRLWKPMVEEIYMLETKQTQKNLHREDRNAIRPSDHHPSNSLALDNPSTSAQQRQDTPQRRTRNEPHDMPLSTQDEPLNVSYDLLSHPHANMAGNNNGGVSLTLGLHQNNGVGSFSESYPVGFPVAAATRRFGLGIQANGDGYVLGGFEAQNRHFGRDVLGGQLLHDFVG
ncbi:BEL1-like homeodomain protein 9 [Momordica charantia]|uniref:BEL1-like homeodomain protein 9 n=1 Tax=Momordica charantia TaxID=3673 RepID=A0A6J1CWH0_MOMCH|nr:BEL1-like homeodomain protein 9 [Momordica charantia]